jgi:polar amino acid transport system substrate-binding protein
MEASNGVALRDYVFTLTVRLAFASGADRILGGRCMKKLLLIFALTAMLASHAEAQQTSDPRVADLVQAGKIRVGIHSFYTKDSRTGELKAVSAGIIFLDMARMLGARIGVEVVPVWHPTIPEMLTCLTAGNCDVGFMGPDPSRTGVDFSPPFVQLDYTFLVPAGSSIQRIADADRPNIRIAVVRGHASTLTLSRIFKHAQLTYAATPDPTFELLRNGQADAFASVRPVLLGYVPNLPGSRVLEDQYGANLVGMVVSKDQTARLAYVTEFIEQAKATGLVQQAIGRSGLAGYQVVPAKTH